VDRTYGQAKALQLKQPPGLIFDNAEVFKKEATSNYVVLIS
jgi:hypothetical protein